MPPPWSRLFPYTRSSDLAEFFSFGTNDLTQMTWGFSRDDVEGAFFSRYIELGIFGVSPFETIDRDRSEEHTSELQSHVNLVCRLLPEKKNTPSATLYTTR